MAASMKDTPAASTACWASKPALSVVSPPLAQEATSWRCSVMTSCIMVRVAAGSRPRNSGINIGIGPNGVGRTVGGAVSSVGGGTQRRWTLA